MSENPVNLLQPIIDDVEKTILAAIKRQLNYLCCFSSNILRLRDEAKKLKDEEDGLQMKVVEAQNNARVILPAVQTWLTDTKKMQDKMTEIDTAVTPSVQCGFLNIVSRYSLSKKAKTIAEEMEKHRNSCTQLDPIAGPAIAPAAMPVISDQTIEFQSRKQIEEDIMKALRNKETNILGICGMGGVGKTTMARKIMHRMKEEKLVEEHVMVVVSQPVDIKKIQGEMAELLGCKELKENEAQQARAQILRARLTGRRAIIILDDIWKEIKLDDIGIPSESGSSGCTILFTSRDKDLLNRMCTQVFAMDVLLEEEAHSLFRGRIGSCADDHDLVSIAKEVVKECRGLPIAIETVGSALKDKHKPSWEDALHQLRGANPGNIPGVIEHVYKPLRLSYDFLENREAKSLFLLCALFPEDYSIDLEDLTMYGVGLDMVEGVDTLAQARNRVATVVDQLQACFLLLNVDDEYEGCVKMHDVVRDVARYICREKGLIDKNHLGSRGEDTMNCKWMWESPANNEFFNHLIGISFPNLRLLIMSQMEISNNSFLEGMRMRMRELRVLSFQGISFKSPPKGMENLQTLNLANCSLDTLSGVGELVGLQILRCYWCKEIEELPVEIGKLKQLKLLDFTYTYIRRIGAGIISELVELEELKMLDSFSGWASEESSSNVVSLKELQSLTKLKWLEIEIEEGNLVNEEMHLPQRLQKYIIRIGGEVHSWVWEMRDDNKLSKVIGVGGFPKESKFGRWIWQLIRDTEGLCIEGYGFTSLDLSQSHHIKNLSLTNCEMLEEAVITRPALKEVYLKNLPNLTQIHDGLILEGSVSFRNLEKMTLKSLPNLTTFAKGIESIEFSMLHSLKISNCLKLERWVDEEEGHGHILDDQTLHLFCNRKVTFERLKEISIQNFDNISNTWCQQISPNFFRILEDLEVWGCGQIRSLFQYPTVDNLVSLTRLDVRNCEHIESIIVSEEIEKNESTSHLAFSKLNHLQLFSLPNLTTLLKGNERIEFSLLETLNIDRCQKLVSIVSPIESGKILGDGHNDGDDSRHLFYNCQVCDDSILEGSISFRKLRKLYLQELPSVSHLLKGWNQHVLFNNLSNIYIRECDKLRNLFQYERANDIVSHLTELRIKKCDLMEQVLLNESEHRCHVTFSNLKTMELSSLPRLTTFGKGIENIEFLVLRSLEISSCPKLERWVDEEEGHTHDSKTLHLFCHQKVKFGGLEDLRIYNYEKESNMWCQQIPSSFFKTLTNLSINYCIAIKSLFSTSIVENFVNLKHLWIGGCKQMERVIADDEQKTMNTITFPKLERLQLATLPSLENFFELKCDLEMSSLIKLSITMCPQMKFLTPGTISTPHLNDLEVDGERFDETMTEIKDLNDFLRQHYLKSTEKKKVNTKVDKDREDGGDDPH